MSVLIKGMQKPKDCYHCRLHYGHGECGVSVDGECPLIELPDHGDLIDRDALEHEFICLSNDEWNKKTGTSWASAFEAAADVVYNAPTVIPAERSEE